MRYLNGKGKKVQITEEKAEQIALSVWNEQMGVREICGATCLPNKQGYGFICSRPTGHKGQHIAIYGPIANGLCAIWDNKEEGVNHDLP